MFSKILVLLPAFLLATQGLATPTPAPAAEELDNKK